MTYLTETNELAHYNYQTQSLTVFNSFLFFLDDDVNQLELLIKCLKIREKILYKHHKDFEEVYYRLYSYYVESGNVYL